MSERLATDPSIAGLRVTLTIHKARGLVAKDRNLFGRKKSSDPYVQVFFRDGVLGDPIGKTKVKKKTLAPVWEQDVPHLVGIDAAARIQRGGAGRDAPALVLRLFDADVGSADDPLGEAVVPVTAGGTDAGWCAVGTGSPRDGHHCKNATGEIRVTVRVTTLLLPDIVAGHVLPLKMKKGHARLRVGLGWETPRHGAGAAPVDLDVSCAALGLQGQILREESVYFANLRNPNGSIVHSGDARDAGARAAGDADGARERLTLDLDRLPPTVAAYVLLVTVATPGVDFSQVASARVQIRDAATGIGFCAFRPACEGACTAVFCLRLCRQRRGRRNFAPGWSLATIGATAATGRDFGSLIPEIKGFCRDLFPEAQIDPNERVAVMNKEVTIRVKDYAPTRGVLPPVLAMGLAWDVTDGVNIDLDASAMCLDARYNVVDLVYFKKLRSTDGAIHHSGDEREGDEVGDDEKIIVALNAVDPRVEHIVFLINSYTEQELDDISLASCHLFDPAQRVDLCTYTLTNNARLDKHTALLLADLYRDAATRDWMMRILSVPSQGKTARRCKDHVVDYLKRVPPTAADIPPDPDVVMTQMPSAVSLDEEISFVPL